MINNMYSLKTKSVPELREICGRKYIRGCGKKNKQALIDIITKHECFHALSAYEDQELESLRLHFNLFRKYVHDGSEEVIPTTEITSDGLTDPVPSEKDLYKFLSTLRDNHGLYPSELNFTEKIDARRSHLYEYHKEGLLSKYGDLGKLGERILLHGTDECNINEILDDDFSFTIDVAHGKMFGKGIYFTQDLSLACKYSERGKMDKYFFVCLVHVGDVVQGTRSMDKLPRMRPDKYYDTSVNTLVNPTQFVKYKPHTYNILGILNLKIRDESSQLIVRPTRPLKPTGGPRAHFLRTEIQTYTNRVKEYERRIQHMISKYGNTRASQEKAGVSSRISFLESEKDTATKSLDELNKRLDILNRTGVTRLGTPSNITERLRIHNRTRMPLEIYYNKHSSDQERYLMSDELRSKLSIHKTSTSSPTIWRKFQTYCGDHKLFYQNSDTGIFLPDQMLMDLLEINPTTRISADNIMKILKSHLTLITDKDLGLILDEDYKHMATIDPKGVTPSSKGFTTQIGHRFVCGYRTQKKLSPNNFILLKKIHITQSTECHYIHT